MGLGAPLADEVDARALVLDEVGRLSYQFHGARGLIHPVDVNFPWHPSPVRQILRPNPNSARRAPGEPDREAPGPPPAN